MCFPDLPGLRLHVILRLGEKELQRATTENKVNESLLLQTSIATSTNKATQRQRSAAAHKCIQDG